MLPGGAYRQEAARRQAAGVTEPAHRLLLDSLPDQVLCKVFKSTGAEIMRTLRLVSKGIHVAATTCISHISLDAGTTNKTSLKAVLNKLPGLTSLHIHFPSLSKLALLDVPGVRERLTALTLNMKGASPSLNAQIRTKTAAAQQLTILMLLIASDKALPVLRKWHSLRTRDLGDWMEATKGHRCGLAELQSQGMKQNGDEFGGRKDAANNYEVAAGADEDAKSFSIPSVVINTLIPDG